MEESTEIFADFRNSIRNKKQHSNGDESFLGKVIYSLNGKILEETVKVNLILTTWGYGNIKIDEGDILVAEKMHLDLSPKYQKYSCATDSGIVINGSSGKCGDYEIRIIEV